jgi:hypothetical protein
MHHKQRSVSSSSCLAGLVKHRFLVDDGARSLTCGSRDPYAAGHVSWPRAGDVSGHLEALQQPHGRVHFAGKHTSVLRGTMERALRSRIRAAREVDEAAAAG